jgi:hypothetical protein
MYFLSTITKDFRLHGTRYSLAQLDHVLHRAVPVNVIAITPLGRGFAEDLLDQFISRANWLGILLEETRIIRGPWHLFSVDGYELIEPDRMLSCVHNLIGEVNLQRRIPFVFVRSPEVLPGWESQLHRALQPYVFL